MVEARRFAAAERDRDKHHGAVSPMVAVHAAKGLLGMFEFLLSRSATQPDRGRTCMTDMHLVARSDNRGR